MSEREVRAVDTRFETRDDAGGKVIEGYFAVFGTEYAIAPGMSETIAPGAFSRTLTENDVRALTNHDTRLVLGRTSVGTLTLREDETGLWGRVVINPNDTDAVNTWERVRRGDVSQCSFGFNIVREDAEYLSDGKTMWTLRDVDLDEVSVCTFPAYKETNIQARSRERDAMARRRFEARKNELRERVKTWQ